MATETRREFLADVGKSMLVASVGWPLAAELGLARALAADDTDALTFGALEPLVALMQETSIHRLQPLLIEQLRRGTALRTLVAAGALANARSFGGQHYVGYHTLMALVPAYEMALQLPEKQRPLPVLKVLYRNTDSIQQEGGRSSEVLHEVEPHGQPADAELLRRQVRARDMLGAERVFARLMQQEAEQAYDNLQFIVQDDLDVHRVVLAWRAWDTLRLAGREHAHTLLRQSVRHCVDAEQQRVSTGRDEPRIRSVLPRLLDQYRLLDQALGTRAAPDSWTEQMSRTIFAGSPEQAADAAAGALAEGVSPESVGEAISLAANLLVLHDPGRSQDEGRDKPRGSVHGASIGVHASDSANAWRQIARVSSQRNTAASLIVGAYHTAGRHGRVADHPFPYAQAKDAVRTTDGAELLRQTEAAVQGSDQARACALVERYGELGLAPDALFGLLLKYAVSEDGALHAEKYYRTVSEEFASTRPAFRWRHLVALARVTASEFGRTAPGHAEACTLLGIEAPGQRPG